MHFKVSDKKPKATIEIDGAEYKIYAPTIEQSDSYSEQMEKISGDSKKVYALMKEHISTLGSIPLDKLKLVPSDMFFDIFKHIFNPEKKS